MVTRLTATSAVLRGCLIASIVTSTAAFSGNADAGNFFNGESLYKKYCQSCHGNRGQGMIGGAPNFARGQGLMKPDALLYETIDRGKNAMPAFRGVLKEEEFYDVITYIRTFYR
jgi:mono/diheme cytochrome c family protein